MPVDALEFMQARSATYSALGLALAPPGNELEIRLLSRRGREELAALLRAVGLPSRGEILKALAQVEPPSREEYDRVFGHTARGRACAYETEYGSDTLFQKPNEIADILGFYRAFGVTTAAGLHERPDHVACECEFMGFLVRKIAYARQVGDPSMAEVTDRAARAFLEDHLGRFAPALAAGLQNVGGYYGIAGRWLGAWIEAECRRLAVEAGPPSLGLRPAEAELPSACGGSSTGLPPCMAAPESQP